VLSTCHQQRLQANKKTKFQRLCPSKENKDPPTNQPCLKRCPATHLVAKRYILHIYKSACGMVSIAKKKKPITRGTILSPWSQRTISAKRLGEQLWLMNFPTSSMVPDEVLSELREQKPVVATLCYEPMAHSSSSAIH
jgi:hypothetical protein